MKTNRLLKLLCLAGPVFLFAACDDDNYQNIVPQGDPQISVAEIGTVLMGDNAHLSVTCSENGGPALSTLKAELCLGGEVTDQATLRTNTEGNYDIELGVPYLPYIPDGEAIIRLTLENVTTKKEIKEIPFNIERPHFSDLQFVCSDGNKYDMTEVSEHTYSVDIKTEGNSFKGYFASQASGTTFGINGKAVEYGATGNIDFLTVTPNATVVTFNTADYTYAPLDALEVKPLVFAAEDNCITKDLVQGDTYSISGIVTDEWFVDNDFFSQNDDGTFTFLAINGTYTLTAYDNYKYLQVFAGTKDAPATIQTDGTGAIWIIGDPCINKPNLAADNNKGWWTGTEWDSPMAQISDKVYRITVKAGEQLSTSGINFKFFGQPDWGKEFKGAGEEYSLVCESDIFYVGESDGNIHLKDGAQINEGEIYIFTIDLRNGTQNAVLSIEKK
ncbi:MAG: DUF5121 domain-containing protein [Bacteroidales bacterium]|nr:DUF5121 domain-containing protein [Bacteroidales bacterium]